MFMKRLSRQEKEEIYAQRSAELQMLWGNESPRDFLYQINRDNFREFVKQMTDEDLGRQMAGTVSQIRFEKACAGIRTLFKAVIIVIVVLGAAGLLLFGIKQLIALF
jgi:hypothetical protein